MQLKEEKKEKLVVLEKNKEEVERVKQRSNKSKMSLKQLRIRRWKFTEKWKMKRRREKRKLKQPRIGKKPQKLLSSLTPIKTVLWRFLSYKQDKRLTKIKMEKVC